MTTPPPTPPDTDAVAFVAALRHLKTWSGHSYRRLERRATAAGHTLPYSTAATMLGRDRLPRAESVAAFVAACGVPEDEADAWLDARLTIACGGLAGTVGDSAGTAGPSAEATGGSPEATDALAEAPRPLPRNRPFRHSRRTLAAVAALIAALLGGVAAAGALTDDVEIERPRTSLHLPRS
ncbi:MULTISPECIES: hypothetical protein [Streptomyces]|nr:MULTISPECIES: hypothetical protein [Streptomyces]MBZ3900311.1 hypothetical protein [Streptomyces griseiscabiei]